MLSSDQQKVLQVAVLTFFVDQGGKLNTLLGLELAGSVSANSSHASHASFVVKHCQDPSVLTKVLNVIDPLEVNPELTPHREIARNPRPALPQEPFSALQLAGGPFVDRDDLRSRLRQLLNSAPAPVLVVNGEPKIGKTYSAQLIAEETTRNPALRAAVLTADATTAPIWDVSATAWEIVRAVSPQPSTPPGHAATPDRLAALLAEWTAIEIERSDFDMWIVLDGFGHPEVPDETDLYVDEVLAMTGRDPRLARTRVVLLDFDVQRLGALNSAYETVVLHLPDEAELTDYFKGCFPELPSFHWETAASWAFKDVPESGPARMPKLHLNVKKVNDVLAQQI